MSECPYRRDLGGNRGNRGGEVRKQMTWAELVAWAKGNGMTPQTGVCHLNDARPYRDDKNYHVAMLFTENLRRSFAGVMTRRSYRTRAAAKRALCRAVSAIREAKGRER